MSNGILIQAQMLIDEEQYDRAYEMLEKAYDKMKDDAEYLEKIALLAKSMEKQEEAIKYWEELVSVDPNSMVGYSELLDIYESTNKYKYYITRAKYKILNQKVSQSIDDYKKAIDVTQDENEIINARFLRAKSYEFLGKTQSAIDDYYRILEYKNDMGIFYKLADMYIQMGDRYSAINILERGVQAFPEVIELSEGLANQYMKEGQYDKALENAKRDITKIKINLMKGENETAFKMLTDVEDKTQVDYFALMAEYYFNLKDWDNCREFIGKFRELEPQNPLVYQMLALVHDANDDAFGYHYYMGRCYSYKQDYELALSEYLNAHRVDASRVEAIKEIIKVNESMNDSTSLMEFYEKLVRQEPENPMALKGLGDLYTNMYEFKNALEYYNKLVKVDSNCYEAYKQIGFCYEKLKDNASAKANYEKYLAKAPLSPDTEKLKEKVDKMSSTTANVEEADGLIDKIMKLFGK
jgi:tetratricopeptide (TPR) repeat protein